MSADCVILAAGLSSRMGQNKLALDIGGVTVLESCVQAFYPSCQRIIVVTGRYRQAIQRLMAPYAKVALVHSENYQDGMFSSVKAGLRHVEADRFFLTPGDYPFIKPQTVARLMSANGCFAVPVYCGEAGHPVLLDKLLIPDILASSHISLRHFLGGLAAYRQELRVDDAGVLADIDTMEDLISYRQNLLPKGQLHEDGKMLGKKQGYV